MIERNYNQSLLNGDAVSTTLINYLLELDDELNLGNASIYHEFPFYRDITNDGLVRANVLLATDIYGLFVFQSISTTGRGDDDDESIANLETLDTLIFSRLIKSEYLKKGRRELKFPITPVIFKPDGGENITDDFACVTSIGEIKDLVLSHKSQQLTPSEFNELKALLEGSKVIPKKSNRLIKDNSPKESKGAILSRIENEIANFDSEQKRAALFTLDSPQRIRGLAGSGKTIILAMKAALIHIQDPYARILYTYYTKSLHDYVKKLITRFYRLFCEKDPNWDNIHIMHAWGGKGLEGVYYNACKLNIIPPMNLRDAQAINPKDPFGAVCYELIKNDLEIQYDYSLLDEAQDFPKSFYQLCRKITTNDRVIWAYDDFQNILDIEIQNEKETFGERPEGGYYIDFSTKDEVLQDLILHTCYRNPRKNLVTAFALGLGIYNGNKKILQRLENNEHWQSLGFEVEEGNSQDGDKMVISRPKKNSPLIKTELLENDIFSIHVFNGMEEESNYVVDSILKDLNDELLPEDICVISLDNKYARMYFEMIELGLNAKNINTFNHVNTPADNIVFKQPNHVTLSTIYKAKGNEAGSVYVIGIDAVFANSNSIVERNKLFTAITRSTAWVSLSGHANNAELCKKEYEKLVANDYKLIFTQPTKESTKTIFRELAVQQEKLNQLKRLAEELKKLGLTEEQIRENVLDKKQKK